jgi:cardiolipin synthase A/B
MYCKQEQVPGKRIYFVRDSGLAKPVRGMGMFLKDRIHVLFCMAICILSVSVSGCSAKDVTKLQNYMPAPVATPGMTLYWGSDVKKQALDLIRSSKHQCYLDIYELSDSDIISALSDAHRRGVDVRVVLDATEKHSQTIGLLSLRKDKVPVEVLKIPQGISHIKMLYADNQVLIGGMNYGAESWLNNDGSVYIKQPNSSFKSLFLWDYNRASGIPGPDPVAIIPLVYDRNISMNVIQAIQNARESVAMEAFDLTDRIVITLLESAVHRGVVVEVLLDPTQSYNRKTASELRVAGITVRFYRPYQNELMHAKMLDIDHGQTFIIGSANFSRQAFMYNHEGDIVLHHVPEFDAAFQNDLSIQISRGTDYPVSGKHSSW